MSAKSSVWRIMEKISCSEVMCLICKSKFKYNNSTTTLLRHIRLKHRNDYDELQAEASDAKQMKLVTEGTSSSSTVQPTMQQALERRRSYGPDSEKQKQLDKLVVRMIVKDMQPLSIVEDGGFKTLVQALDPKYTLPSRRQIVREHLPQLYEEQKANVQSELDAASGVSVTTDIWTSRKTESFMTVTAHFITKEWELKSIVLETPRLTSAHTAVNIADELKRVFDTWKISTKITCIVTDNASNMKAAVGLLNMRHVPCYAHTLNLVVEDALKLDIIPQLRKKVKQIVSFFHHSVKASDKLEELQRIQGKTPLKLKQDVQTRWNSTYFMFERYIALHEFVTAALCNLNKQGMLITGEEKETIENCISALQSFEMASREMSAEKFTSISKVIPMTSCLIQHLNKMSQSNPSPLVKTLKLQLEKRCSSFETSLFNGAATLLDPRFKKHVFGANEDSVKAVESHLSTLMPVMLEEPTAGPSSTPEEEESAGSAESFWTPYNKQVSEIISSTAKPRAGPEIKFMRFYEERLITMKEDPLAWWKRREQALSELADLARNFLAAPATSVPSERLFSKAGELLSVRRTSLKDSQVDKILFLNKNLS